MKLSWTPEALLRLIEMEEFMARDSPVRAEGFVDALVEKTSLILDNPETGRIVPEISNNSIRELLIKNYRVVYRVKASQIDILTVFDGHKFPGLDEIPGEPEELRIIAE